MEQITHDRRLIEETFPVKQVSIESAKEKNIRQGNISTLHIWWARRPIASSRATNYASLVAAPKLEADRDQQRKFVASLAKWESSLNRNLLDKARANILQAHDGRKPTVLDPFAGGGAIPLEALRLSCETYASDYNPVATFLLKCTLEYPQKYGANISTDKGGLSTTTNNELLTDVRKWGEWIFKQAYNEIGKYYPEGEAASIPVGYVWARTIHCQNPACNCDVPLIRQYWLANKGRRKIALLPVVRDKKVEFKIVGTGHGNIPAGFDPSVGSISQAIAVCPVCKSSIDGVSIRKQFNAKKSGTRLIAVVSHREGVALKNYRLSNDEDIRVFRKAEQYLKEKQSALKEILGIDPVPDELIHTPDNKEYRPGGLLYNFTPVLLYGMTKWGDLFNSRQKLALITLSDKVRQTYDHMIKDGYQSDYARAVTSFLALNLDRLVDKAATLCIWSVTDEYLAHVFGRQALPMTWDYFELNPFSKSTGDWLTALSYIQDCLKLCCSIRDPATVKQCSATSLPYQDNFFDAVFTDPPYYDNVPYADLSDFFYVWLKRSIGHLYPDLFSTPLTPKSDETIAELPLLRGMDKVDAAKVVTGIKTGEHFENSLRRSFKEIHRVLKPNGISVIVYAHKSTAGWETLVNSLLDSGLVVTGSWPIHTEMKGRLRAKESAALASSIYMIARKTKKRPTGFYKEVKQELENHLSHKLDSLWKEGISGADFFISAIGSAIQVFGIYDGVIDDEGQAVRADRLLEDVRRIVADYAVKQVLHNGFAAKISKMTRFYVLWRWAYGDAKLDFDDARKLASGVGIDLALEWNQGFIEKEKQYIEVLGPEERNMKDLQGSKEIVDVLHNVLLLWKQGKNDDVINLLKETGLGESDVFFRVAQAISESLPIESKEKKLLDGFLTGRQRDRREYEKGIRTKEAIRRMKPFHTIAIPDKDILEGRLTMDVFAADLWETYSGRAPEEYRDSFTFFKKTYLTEDLKNLLSVVQKRLQGAGGDPVIQIQTPFGGGKTHALIAMYHKAKEWEAKTAVVVGTVLGAEDTIWGIIEKQLTGSIKLLSGNVSPGRDKIRKILEKSEPVLILMDELLQYAIKAAGVKVGESSLAAQTIAFMQELTEVAGTLEKTCVVVTLPSSALEHFDEKGEKLFQELQKRAGRVEKIYTPVGENEIAKVIRQRLFSSVDAVGAKNIVSNFMDYAEKAGIPADKESSDYRTKFLESYPFSPEVVQVLYERWGSFPTFQRTRGVLRLLSLVIYSLKESASPYITLADFDLAESEIRRELIKHIGNEFDGVISSDISSTGSGSKTVDKSLGRTYQGLSLGTRAAVSIFLYSFSGGPERGAHLGEVKRSATTIENPSSVVAEAVEQLKNKLFFLQSQNDKYFFSNQPNLNRILLTKMENVKEAAVVDAERDLLKHEISPSSKLKVFVWPQKPKDIPDNPELKLVIIANKNNGLMNQILSTKGETPRVYKNTIFFLTSSEAERSHFVEQLKKKIAYQQIEADKTLALAEEQKREIKNNVKKEEDNVTEGLRRLYRLAFIPSKDGLRELDIGIPTYGEKKGIDEEVYDKLRAEQEILERIAPLVIREMYLKDKDYAKTSLIYDSMLKTPGERRTVGNNVLEQSFSQGAKHGLFGLGELQDDGKPLCRFFKEDPGILSFGENEILIKDSVCLSQRDASGQTFTVPSIPGTSNPAISSAVSTTMLAQDAKANSREELVLRFKVPIGKISQIMGMMNFLQSKFKKLEVEISAKEGSLSEEEYTSKIKEALRQLGVDLEE